MVQIPGLAARRAALRLIDAVLRRGETLDQAGKSALSGLLSADAALSRAIAGEVLRWRIDLDALIDSATRSPLPEDAKARAVLQLMLTQHLRLDTPAHAVIATGLPLLSGGPRRLAHGVFSTLLKRNVRLPAAPTLPSAVVERWAKAWPGRVDAIAAALAVPPPLDLTLRDPAETALWQERLGGESFMPGHLRLPRGSAVDALAGFNEGAWWVQDFAASLPARLLGRGEGRRALDLCAAPGGKALQLSAAGWDVTALDNAPVRMRLLEQNAERTRLPLRTVTADVLQWEGEGMFEAILLDAPCTATGTCRRHPDVLHRVGADQLAQLVPVQAKMVERAAAWLKPGGRLVYAVCSLEPEEGERQAAAVVLRRDPIQPDELPAGIAPDPGGFLRTDPGMLPQAGGLDGFFIARWCRR